MLQRDPLLFVRLSRFFLESLWSLTSLISSLGEDDGRTSYCISLQLPWKSPGDKEEWKACLWLPPCYFGSPSSQGSGRKSTEDRQTLSPSWGAASTLDRRVYRAMVCGGGLQQNPKLSPMEGRHKGIRRQRDGKRVGWRLKDDCGQGKGVGIRPRSS